MLKAVIDGATFQRVADHFGVSRTAVEWRVKAFIRQLIESVGVEGLTAERAVYVHRMRKSRDSILIALSQFSTEKPVSARANPQVVSEVELTNALRRIAARSIAPLRDQALFSILFVTGARPLEIARLEVADYLHADGSIRTHSEIRAEVAITGKSRPLYFANARLNLLLSEYLQERLINSHGIGAPGAFRGLDPKSRLFLSHDGQGFAIVQYGEVGQRRYLCQAILELYRKLFRQSKLHGISAMSVRQTVAARMYERGADEEQIGLLLGVSDRHAVKDQFPRPKRCLYDIVCD